MGYEVDLKNAENLEKTASEIHLLANENWEAVPVTKIPAYAPIFDWLKLQHQNVWFILILMMAVAIINMSSVVLILVIERTPTIGVLHALGMRPRNIQSIFVWNMFFLMVIGLVIGNIVGLGLLASQYFFKWLTLDPESYFIDSVPVAWVWTQFFWINLITIVVCSLMMYIPTLIIARINPTKAIRFQ
jgi:lipoprotein-releasing system permease protein